MHRVIMIKFVRPKLHIVLAPGPVCATMSDDSEESRKSFLAASFTGGLLGGTRLITGFIRGKMTAELLGTAGVGVVAQGNQLGLLSAALGSLAMAVGIINLLAAPAYRSDSARADRMRRTAFTAQLSASLVLVVVGVLASGSIARAVFGLPDDSMVIGVLLGLPFTVMASGYLEGLFFGMNRYDLYVKASIWGTILGIFAFLILITSLGLDGAVWSISASGFLLFASFVYFALPIVPPGGLFRFGLEPAELKALLRVSFVMLLTGVSTYATSLVLRKIVIDRLGLDAAGILQVPLALTAYYTPFLTNALWGRLYYQVAENGDCERARRELRVALRFNVTLNAFIVSSVLVWPELLVRLTYSGEFSSAVALLPLEFLGDMFYFVMFTFGVYFLASGKLWWYLLGWIAYYGATLLLAARLCPALGVKAVPVAYLVVSAAGALGGACWLALTSERKPWAELAIFGGLLVLVAIQAFLAEIGSAQPWRLGVPLLCGFAFMKIGLPLKWTPQAAA